MKAELQPMNDEPMTGFINMQSVALGEAISATYTLPACAKDDPGRTFPVVYVLHGKLRDLFGPTPQGLMRWQATEAKGRIGTIEVETFRDIADVLEIIIIGVNGGLSMYHDSPRRADVQYATHVTTELIPTVEELLPVVADRTGRALVGHSMGAMGVSYLGLLEPERYAALGCRSGAFHLLELARNGCAFDDAFPKDLGDWKIGAEVFGQTITEADYRKWTPYCMIDQVDPAAMPALSIDIGIHDTMPDFVRSNRLMHEKLLERDIPHIYRETPDGHDWVPYLCEQITWATQVMRAKNSD